MAKAADKPHTVNVEAGVYAPEGAKVTFEDAPQDATQDATQPNSQPAQEG